ncbi:MAG: MCE family protein [Thermoleophilaceae bacterium]|nr:MCE family protein [Thermoleophilaceae bacterium]
MIKRAPSPAQLISMIAFAFTCFALILFLWVSFGGPIPLKPQGYRVNVTFTEAVQLAVEADVRISGVPVGKVKAVEPERGRTGATLEIDSRYAPLPDDVKAILRSKTLLGETFVELTPGTKGTPTIPENGAIPASQVSNQVQLDEVIRIFDPATRAAFGDWLIGQSDAVKGRGDLLNQAFGVLPMFFTDANSLIEVLHRQDKALSRLFANTADIFEAINSRPGQLTQLILASNRLLRVTANRSQQLIETFNEFPQFLRETRQTIDQFEEFADGTQALIANSSEFADASSPIMKKSVQVSNDARLLVNSLEPMLDKADAGLPATDEFLDLAKPSLAQLDPFLANLNPVLQFVGEYQRELTAFAANDAAASQAQLTNADPSIGRTNWGHYLRAFVQFTPDNLAYYPNKTTKTRSNAYPVPGWYDRLASGLQVFDSGACGTIAVPALDPDDTLYPTTPINLQSLLPLINSIIYAGESTPNPSGTTPPAVAANLAQSPNNAANLPAPNCEQQGTRSFQGQSLQFPQVNESSNAKP